jgi:uncharacterized NAD(P)/FAD-binding protein YdhS
MALLSQSEEKSLALHRALAMKIQDDPALLAVVRNRLAWLREKNPSSAPYYDRWERLVDGDLQELLHVMTDSSERSCALRQESPFVDIVDQKERARIYREVSETLRKRARA